MELNIRKLQNKDNGKDLASIDFGREIERLRELRGFKTQKAFAEAVKIDKSIISDIEGGKTNPSLTVIKKLADILEVSPYALISIYYGIPIPGYDPKGLEVLTQLRRIILGYYGLTLPDTLEGPRKTYEFVGDQQANTISDVLDQQIKDANSPKQPEPLENDKPEDTSIR